MRKVFGWGASCGRESIHKLDAAGSGLEGEHKGDGAKLQKQPHWSENKSPLKVNTGRQTKRQTEREKDREEIWGLGDGMCP